MTAKQEVHRAAFLMGWFLSVFKGRKAPFPRRSFKGIAHLMEQFLEECGTPVVPTRAGNHVLGISHEDLQGRQRNQLRRPHAR